MSRRELSKAQRAKRREDLSPKELEKRRGRLQKAFDNPILRPVVSRASALAVKKELTEGKTTEEMLGGLDTLMSDGVLGRSALANAIRRKAPGEMDKAIRRFRREGKEISVATLCAEVYADKRFQATCAKVGIPVSWFEDLARARMEVMKIEGNVQRQNPAG